MKPFTLLRPQEIIVDHLRSVDNALVFAGMGISKTAACLYRLTELLLNGESVAALVIAPMRVASLTWPAEARDWQPFTWLRVANLRTEAGQRHFLNGTAHLYLINYESLHHLVSLVERRRGELPYDITIFDESTKAKNPDSKRINTFRRKVPRTQRNWLLTGTPIPNSNLDIFAQARLCDGGERLGRNYLAFKKEYFMQPSYPFAPWKEKNGAKEAIENKISDLTITLKSSDWLDLPDTIFEDIEVHFPAELMEKYRLLEKELVLELTQGQTLNVANAAALVTKLLQFTAGSVYDENKEVHAVHDLKFNALARIVKDEKKPLFVLCIFQHEQSRIRSLFPQAQFFADAKTEKAQRDLLERWNAGKVPMLVAHPASVGHGLNLQYGSSVMVWTSLTYSRENYEQSIARLVRRGQKDPVKVYRLIIPGTVDDAVVSALESKAENEARLISALQMLESYRTQGGQKP